MIITHNLSAIQTNRNLNLNSRGLAKSLEKLSSGYRINVGADGPADLVISEQLRSQLAGVQRAVKNTGETSNLIGITEGALNEMNEILKKMRQLALHAANHGVTSPEQVRADQAEVDSGIATLQRIADTTRYSDQYLLNGNRQLTYDRATTVNVTNNHALLDTQGSRLDQVFKRDGVALSFAFNGVDDQGYVKDSVQAKRAYLEADRVEPDPHAPGAYQRSDAQYDEENRLTHDQEFILTGTKGSKLFKFSKGDSLGRVASIVNNMKDSTGVGASLIFSANARVDVTANGVTLGTRPDFASAAPAFDPTTYASTTDVLRDASDASVTISMAGEIADPAALAAALGVKETAVAGLISSCAVALAPPAGSPPAGPWTLTVDGPGGERLFEASWAVDTDAALAVEDGPLAGLSFRLSGLVDATNTETAMAGAGAAAYAASFDAALQSVRVPAGQEWSRATGDAQIYGADLNEGLGGTKVRGVTIAQPDDFRAGLNCDGEGRLFARVTRYASEKQFEVQWFKDEDCTMLVGTSVSPTHFAAANNSGIRDGGLLIQLTNNAKVGDVYTVALLGQEFAPARDGDGVGGIDQPFNFDVTGIPDWTGMSASSLATAVVSGVQLGQNTDAEGMIHFRATGPADNRLIEVFSSDKMTPDTLVAVGRADLSATGQRVIRLEEVTLKNGQKSGFNMTLPFSAAAGDGEERGRLQFVEIGLRLFAEDYGSGEYLAIQNNQGQLFHQYRDGDTLVREMVPEKTTVRVHGQDARLSVNGFPIRARGLLADVANGDVAGAFKLNAGILGQTTVGVAGHERGSLMSRAGALQCIAENERAMQRLALSQGYTLVPQQTTLALLDGVWTGLTASGRPERPDSGTLKIDFSGIDPNALSEDDRLDLEAALANGVKFTLLRGTDPGLDANGQQLPYQTVTLALEYVDRNGVTQTMDLSALPPAPETPVGEIPFHGAEPADATTSGGGLNERHGFTFRSAAGAFGIFEGLTLSADEWTDAVGLDGATAPDAASVTVQGVLVAPAWNALSSVVTYATTARARTTETLDNLQGGMQLQLGGNEGDQDRTVYSIPSMVVSNLGRVEIDGRVYTLNDVLGSSDASLVADPITAMKVIARAIDDVATLRGRLGAFQANTLETNRSSLEVAVEMITKTESGIRDADMASESTEFTKNQIMVQAGAAMLAQANTISQNVLQLLG